MTTESFVLLIAFSHDDITDDYAFKGIKLQVGLAKSLFNFKSLENWIQMPNHFQETDMTTYLGLEIVDNKSRKAFFQLPQRKS